jgi:hypothetical protein
MRSLKNHWIEQKPLTKIEQTASVFWNYNNNRNKRRIKRRTKENKEEGIYARRKQLTANRENNS